MEAFAHTVNLLHSAAGLLILGTAVICLISLGSNSTTIEKIRQQFLNSIVFLALILVTTGLFLPSLQAVSIAGDSTEALNLELLKLILFSTRFGSVWFTQEGLSLLLLFSLLFHRTLISSLNGKCFFIWIIAISSTLLFVGSLKSHAAGLEPAWPGLLGHGVHLLAAGCWLGALPALGFFLHASSQKTPNTPDPLILAQVLNRFSIIASIMVGIILLSGTLIGYLQISRWGELFSTPYGHYLLVKILLFIMMVSVAGIIRLRYMPQNANINPSLNINATIAKWVALETCFGFILLGFANVLKSTTPASHETNIIWPFGFRFSLDATWGEMASVQTQVFLGLMLIGLAIGLSIYLFRFKHYKKMAFIAGFSLSIAGVAIALQPLGVKAYPDTYRNSSVPYNAISIRNGGDIFSQHCASCHGAEGKGDGVLAETLDVMVMDLNHMHSADSTAGDMYWKFTQELSVDNFHSPISSLDEDETWELINYLNASAASFTGTSLYTYIESNKPFLGAPDFYYSTDVTSGNLIAYRKEKAILLVLFSWPEGKARLDNLKIHYKDITANNTEIIAVEITKPDSEMATEKPDYPFVLVTEQTEPIVNAYSLFRRSFMSERDFDFTRPLTHIEYIVDRFGYLRARWDPTHQSSKWTDFSLLTNELAKLAKEPEILPPPNEHVH